MTRSAPRAAHKAPFSGPPATAMTRAPAALPSWIPAVPSPLAAECTTRVSPAWRRPRLKRARWEVWKDRRKAVASTSSKSGGASNTEMASAIAYSAMPPRAFLVMATTRWPSHDSAPSPAASTTPQTSMPSVNGGGVGTETRLPRQRSMSLKLSDAALTFTRTSPGPGSGRSIVRTNKTSPGGPCRVTCTAFMSATRPPPSSSEPGHGERRTGTARGGARLPLSLPSDSRPIHSGSSAKAAAHRACIAPVGPCAATVVPHECRGCPVVCDTSSAFVSATPRPAVALVHRGEGRDVMTWPCGPRMVSSSLALPVMDHPSECTKWW